MNIKSKLDEHFLTLLKNIEREVQKVLEKPKHIHYTDHGVEHSERIIKTIGDIFGSSQDPDMLNAYEIFILLASAYLHDVGMQSARYTGLPDKPEYTLEDKEIIREKHAESSAKMILESVQPNSDFSLGLEGREEYVPFIANIVRYHSGKGGEDINSLKDSSLKGEYVRLKLLAALLKLADGLDRDYRRVKIKELKFWPIPTESKFHWWTHHYTQSVTIKDGRIKLYFRFPEEYRESKIKDVFIKNTQRLIKEELEAVSDVLWDPGIRLTPDSNVGDISYVPKGIVELVPNDLLEYIEEIIFEVKHYIAPWALPRENIPINIEWGKDVVFNEIRIEIPDDFRFVDFLNVKKFSIAGNVATISSVIECTFPDAPLYCGFLVSSTEIPDKLKAAKKILVEFLHEDKVIKSLKLYARIFRPVLEVTETVEKIELHDDQEKLEIPINLKYIGFGDIRLKIEAGIGGRIVSHGESIIYELLRRLWLSDVLADEGVSEGEEKRKRIHVEQPVLQEFSEQLGKKIESGDISGIIGMIEEGDVEDFKRWLSDVKTKEKFMEVIYSRIEDLLLGLLTDLLERYPTDSVKLANARTKIKAKIELPVETIKIRLKYTDSIENEYTPVEIQLKIEDKRVEKRKTIIDIPIIIEMEEEPFKNVAEMKMEIPAYQNFVISEMRDESFNRIGRLWWFEDGKWKLNPSNLPPSERYLLTLKGKLPEDTLTKIVFVQQAANKDRTEEETDRYWLTSMIRNVEILEKLWDALNVDDVIAGIKIGIENCLSSALPKELKSRIEGTQRWIRAGRGRDREEVWRAWGEMHRLTKESKISVEEIVDIIYKLTTGETFSKFLTVDRPYIIGEIMREETFKRTFPDRMHVETCTYLTLKQPAATGFLTFKKKDYIETVKKEFKELL